MTINTVLVSAFFLGTSFFTLPVHAFKDPHQAFKSEDNDTLINYYSKNKTQFEGALDQLDPTKNREKGLTIPKLRSLVEKSPDLKNYVFQIINDTESHLKLFGKEKTKAFYVLPDQDRLMLHRYLKALKIMNDSQSLEKLTQLYDTKFYPFFDFEIQLALQSHPSSAFASNILEFSPYFENHEALFLYTYILMDKLEDLSTNIFTKEEEEKAIVIPDIEVQSHDDDREAPSSSSPANMEEEKEFTDNDSGPSQIESMESTNEDNSRLSKNALSLKRKEDLNVTIDELKKTKGFLYKQALRIVNELIQQDPNNLSLFSLKVKVLGALTPLNEKSRGILLDSIRSYPDSFFSWIINPDHITEFFGSYKDTGFPLPLKVTIQDIINMSRDGIKWNSSKLLIFSRMVIDNGGDEYVDSAIDYYEDIFSDHHKLPEGKKLLIDDLVQDMANARLLHLLSSGQESFNGIKKETLQELNCIPEFFYANYGSCLLFKNKIEDSLKILSYKNVYFYLPPDLFFKGLLKTFPFMNKLQKCRFEEIFVKVLERIKEVEDDFPTIKTKFPELKDAYTKLMTEDAVMTGKIDEQQLTQASKIIKFLSDYYPNVCSDHLEKEALIVDLSRVLNASLLRTNVLYNRTLFSGTPSLPETFSWKQFLSTKKELSNKMHSETDEENDPPAIQKEYVEWYASDLEDNKSNLKEEEK